MDLVRDVDALRTMGHAGVAADASVSLAESRQGKVLFSQMPLGKGTVGVRAGVLILGCGREDSLKL